MKCYIEAGKECECVKKRIAFLVTILVCCLFVNTVNAKEVYYENNNGVQLTQEEYDFLQNFYWTTYPDTMTEEMYSEFIESNIMNGEIETKKIYFGGDYLARGTFFQDSYRSLGISKSCDSSYCYVSAVLEWLSVPYIKSYDVMGAYLDGTTLVDSPLTTVSSTTGGYGHTAIKTESDGFGASFLLPTSGRTYIIGQNFTVTRGGHVYASYQHAMSNTTLNVSQNFSISYAGYGGVFNFGSNAQLVYDQMNGVDISVD